MLRITQNVINLFLRALTRGRTHKITPFTVVQGGRGGGGVVRIEPLSRVFDML